MKTKKKSVVVIGGGLAGMIAASYLNRFGRRVILLEQNHHTGGNMSGFNRSGYYFDGGDQSFESLGIVFPILKDLGVYDELEWAKVRYRMVSEKFDFFIDSFDAVESALMNAYPAETRIPELFREVRKVSAFLDRHCTAHSFPALNDFSFTKLFEFIPDISSLIKWLTYDYRVKVCSIIKDPALRHWLTEIGYYRMPFIFFAGFWNLWIRDYWYPIGGIQKMNDLLMRKFTDAGGELRCNTMVEKIELKNRKAVGVRTTKGEFIEADDVIYAGDYRALISGILDPALFPRARADRLQSTRLTESLVTVYLGVNIPAETLNKHLQTSHTFWFPNTDVIFPNRDSDRDVHKRMWLAINFFGKENPDFAPPGKSTLVLQTYSTYDWQNFWHNGSGNNKRTDEYKAFKMEIGKHLVELAENLIPGLEKKIDFMDIGTPLSSKRFSMNSDGSSGGWCYNDKISPIYKNNCFNMMSTPVSNVRVAGHYSLWPGGVISAALSGRIAANIVAGRPALAPLGKD